MLTELKKKFNISFSVINFHHSKKTNIKGTLTKELKNNYKNCILIEVI